MIVHEIASKKVLPLLRAILAHDLIRAGLSQHRVSKILGVTQPLINRYLKKKREHYLAEFERLGVAREEVENCVALLKAFALKNDFPRFVVISMYVVNRLSTRIACASYESLADVCSRGSLADPDIEAYRSFVTRLVGRLRDARLVPEVGANIVYAPREPGGPEDVIALTGRIVKAEGGILALGEPMYGASRHLSRVLLEMPKELGYRVAIVIAFLEEVLENLRRAGYRVVETGPHESEEDFWSSISAAAREAPEVIADRGGRGLEPVIYIFARDFEGLEKALDAAIRGTRR
ncbi:MAG: thiamine-phosphate synthase family protein [Desulfurococcaceae archaeon]